MSITTFDRYLDWDTFSRDHWDQSVVHVRECRDHPFTAPNILSAAASASTQYAQCLPNRDTRPGVVLTIGRRQHPADPDDLPRPSDSTLDGYTQRVHERMQGQRYALIINTLHAYDYALWAKERYFVDRLWQNVGIPTSSPITTLFHGNYQNTPVGVHTDRFATFMFAVRGRKRMRFWSQRPWPEAVTSKVDYAEYLAQSFSIVVEAGDMLYWPSHYYHVGEGVDEDVATSVNIGVPVSAPLAAYYVDDLLFSEQHRPSNGQSELYAHPSQPGLPQGLRAALQDIRQRSTNDSLRDCHQQLWCRRLSAAALEPVPDPRERQDLRPDDQIRLEPDAMLLWVRQATGVIVVAANGHIARIIGRPHIEALLRQLNSGASFRVASLLLKWPDDGDPNDADLLPANVQGGLRLLERLVSMRALRKLHSAQE